MISTDIQTKLFILTLTNQTEGLEMINIPPEWFIRLVQEAICLPPHTTNRKANF